jgi:hypothetical protein
MIIEIKKIRVITFKPNYCICFEIYLFPDFRTWYESQIPSSPPDTLEIREGSNEEEEKGLDEDQLIVEDIEEDANKSDKEDGDEDCDIYDERLEEVVRLAESSAAERGEEVTLSVELEHAQQAARVACEEPDSAVSPPHALLGEIQEVHEGDTDSGADKSWKQQEQTQSQKELREGSEELRRALHELREASDESRGLPEELRRGPDDYREGPEGEADPDSPVTSCTERPTPREPATTTSESPKSDV